MDSVPSIFFFFYVDNDHPDILVPTINMAHLKGSAAGQGFKFFGCQPFQGTFSSVGIWNLLLSK